jgi:hypothetical protein
MADIAFAFGLGAGTQVTGIGIVVIESFDMTPVGEKFELRGNNAGQTVVATRYTNTGDLIRVTGECDSVSKPSAMRGQATTVKMYDDSTSPICTANYNATVIEYAVAGNRGAWQVTATLRLGATI